MSDATNPYAGSERWFRSYKQELQRTAHQQKLRVPTLAAVHEAYVADEIDHIDLEQLTHAALTDTRVEIPKAMRHRLEPRNNSSLDQLRREHQKRGTIRSAAYARSSANCVDP